MPDIQLENAIRDAIYGSEIIRDFEGPADQLGPKVEELVTRCCQAAKNHFEPI